MSPQKVNVPSKFLATLILFNYRGLRAFVGLLLFARSKPEFAVQACNKDDERQVSKRRWLQLIVLSTLSFEFDDRLKWNVLHIY